LRLISSSILLGTIQIVPSSSSGLVANLPKGGVTREVLGSLVLPVLLRYCPGAIESFSMSSWGGLS